MPRKGKESKKQTRLAFAPTPAAAPEDNGGDNSERYRTLSYGHPSLATIVPKGSRKSKSSSSSQKSSKSSREVKPTTEPKAQVTIHKIDDSSSEDDIVIPSAQKRRQRAPDIDTTVAPSPPKLQTSKTKKRSRQPSTSSDEDTAEETKETKETPRPRRKLKRKAESSPVILIDSDSDDEPVLSSPVKRKRTFVPQDTPETPRASADQDYLDIEEDVRDLQDSVVKKNRTRGRQAGSARDKRFKTLEAIRRKRAGQKEESDESGTGSDGDADSPSKHGNQIDEEEDEDEEDEGAEEQVNPSDEDLDRYEDDFVLDDENTLLGVPTEEIPFEFTRHAYKKPKDYFRDVVGWMIHNRLDPAFPRADAMYEMAFMKLEDEVKGRAGSQLISSVWNPDFRYALLARPHIEITSYPTEDCHSCDACNRSGHPASSDMKLYGKPYSLETLEPLADSDGSQAGQTSDSDSDSDDGDNAKGLDRDREGHLFPDENNRFLLGRQCKHRAQLAHTLTHWRFHLYEWVVDYLKRMGHMSDEQVLRRNNMSQKKKTRNAIKVLESMIEAGEIDKLYRDFHMTLKSAREETS